MAAHPRLQHCHHSTITAATVLLLISALPSICAHRSISYFDQFRSARHLLLNLAQGHDVTVTTDHEPQLTSLLTLKQETIWKTVLESVGDLSDSAQRGQVGNLQRSGQEVGDLVDTTCLNHTAATVVGLLYRETWAIRMLDAMGKPVPGITDLNIKWPGAYDLCRSVRANLTVASHIDFSGKYCNLEALLSPKPVGGALVPSLLLGICVPDTCSEFDVLVIVNDVLHRLNVTLNVGTSCPVHDKPLDAKAGVAIAICSVLLLLMVLGTVADLYFIQSPKWIQDDVAVLAHEDKNKDHVQETTPLLSKTPPSETKGRESPGICIKLLVAFSVYTNGSKLLSTAQAPGSLTCVHGIRFLSMTWVVLGHAFMSPMYNANNVLPYLKEVKDRWTFQAIANALVSVDSFFVLSGLLVAYLTLKELKKNNGKINWFMFYFHRFWRLTPPYMLIVMVYSWLSPYWSHGPFASSFVPDRDGCKWWSNLLYINNFVSPEEMCLGQSWYLANDMQFYCVLSPLVILPLFYKPLVGVVVAVVLVAISCITSGVLVAVNDFPPGMFAQVQSNHTDLMEWQEDYYIKPYTRMGPYVIGMLAGYFLYRYKCKLNINWYTNIFLWAVATASALAVLYGLYGASTGHPMTVSVSALYTALHRNVWGLCLCWVIVACVTGNAGFVNTLLSWPAFIPLSRLTYCIYLLHFIVMSAYVGNFDTAFYFNDINVVAFFIFVLVISYMAALIASLAFEAPMMMLEKVLFHRHFNRKDNEIQHPAQNGHHLPAKSS